MELKLSQSSYPVSSFGELLKLWEETTKQQYTTYNCCKKIPVTLQNLHVPYFSYNNTKQFTPYIVFKIVLF